MKFLLTLIIFLSIGCGHTAKQPNHKITLELIKNKEIERTIKSKIKLFTLRLKPTNETPTNYIIKKLKLTAKSFGCIELKDIVVTKNLGKGNCTVLASTTYKERKLHYD